MAQGKLKKGAALFALLLLLGGCGAVSYQDGSYTGQSSVFEALEDADGDAGGDGYGVVELTVSGGKVTACSFQTFQADGTLKGEDYGKQNGEIANQDYYNKAQRAVQASENYAQQLAAKGELKEVDAISGATISYQQFEEAVNNALDQAKGGS